MLASVYVVTNPIGQKYVGSTENIAKRRNAYKNNNTKGQLKVRASIEKYGFLNHSFEIAWSGDAALRYKMERIIGDSLNCTDNKNGLNSMLPGYDDVPAFKSEEMIAKFKASFKPKPLSKEIKDRMSKNSRRIKPSEETIAKVKLRLMRPIDQYDLNGSFIKHHSSATDAGKELNISRTNIKNNLNGYSNSAGGFVFKFKDSVRQGQSNKKVRQMNLEGEFVALYNSISEAARSVNVDFSSIRYVVRGFGKTAAGYKWELV